MVITSRWRQAPKRYSRRHLWHDGKIRRTGNGRIRQPIRDDENTSLIAYLANERKYDVYYLSMTRGDGGQNLIGPEIPGLGVIRTQELLAARRIDGETSDSPRQWLWIFQEPAGNIPYLGAWWNPEWCHLGLWNVKNVVIGTFNGTDQSWIHAASAMLSVKKSSR